MKLVIARLNHETNTFSPLSTPLHAFGAGHPDGPAWGRAALAAGSGSATAMGAFIELAQARGCGIDTPVSAMANPSGPVDAEAYDRLCGAIVDSVGAGCDAVLLDLHGAMVAQNSDDGEGDLLARVRAAAAGAPIAVALDLHANVTPLMVENSDIIVGFKTYPHVDMVDTGRHAGRLLFDLLDGGAAPAMALARPRVLAQTLAMNTEVPGAMRDAVDAARAAERDGALAATVFGGFPAADVPGAGMSVIVVDRDRASAARRADALAHAVHRAREGFVYHQQPLAGSVARAKFAPPGLVLMVDHGDNCMSGGTCDTMDVVEECLRQGLTGLCAGPIHDPGAVARAVEAGIGARLHLPIGNKVGMPAIGLTQRSPLVLEGRVRAICDGEFVVTGPIYTGARCFMGRTVLFETAAASLVLSEQTQEPFDLGVLRCAGVEPARFRYLILKSRMYYRPEFAPLASTIIECASAGVCSSDLALFPYRRISRPIFPLDKE